MEIQIGDEVLSLTLAQARELRDILNSTFPEKSVETIPVPTPYPVPYPVWPYRRWAEPVWVTNKGVYRRNDEWAGRGTLRLTCKA